MSTMDVQQTLKEAEEGLRTIHHHLAVVASDLSNDTAKHLHSPSFSPSSLPSLLPFPSPRAPVLHQLKQLVEQTQHHLHSHAEALKQTTQPPPAPSFPAPPPLNPDIGLTSHSTSSSTSSYPLSFALPRSPPPVPTPHQPAITSVLESRHAHFLATPDRDASRAYLIQRFGLTEEGERTRKGRRPIEVYGRIGGGAGRRKTTPARERKQQSSIGPLHPTSSFPTRSPQVSRVLESSAVPRQLQHLGLFELVNRGYLPSNLDVGAVGNDQFASQRPRGASTAHRSVEKEGEEEKSSSSLDDAMTSQRSSDVHPQPAEEESMDSAGDEEEPIKPTISSSTSSSSAASLSHRARHHSRVSRYSGLSTEEEQKQQMEDERDLTLPSSTSTTHRPHLSRGRSLASSASIGSLHDSFTVLPSHSHHPSHSTSSTSSLPSRSYDSLLDDFSHHPFFVHHGRVLTDTPEFSSFQRAHSQHWPALTALINRVIEFAGTIKGGGLVTFYGSALVSLVERGVKEPTRDELMACLAPVDLQSLKDEEQRDEGRKEQAAASLITATLRMHVDRKKYAVMKRRDTAARTIQRQWRRYRALQMTRRFVRGKWQEKVERWKVIQQQWIGSYNQFSQRHRVHVHIPSLSLPTQQRQGLFPHLSLYENQHLPRVCELSNPLISIIYLTATPLPSDVQTYYLKLLEVGGVKDLPNRLHFLSPELSSFFSSLAHPFPLASLALYSARLLSSVRSLLRQRPAVIIPADAGFSDWMLAVELGLPLYCLDVEKKQRMDGVGGTRRWITTWNERVREEKEKERERVKEEQHTAPHHSRRPSSGGGVKEGGGGVMQDEIYTTVSAGDVFDEDELYSRLTELMMRYREVEVWCMRMEEDREGRGVAWVEVGKVVGLREALQGEMGEEEKEEKVEAMLAEQLMERVVLLHPSFYLSVSVFFASFFQQGGVIIPYPSLPSFSSPLTSPSVQMLIEPNGQLTMLSSHDSLLPQPFFPLLSTFPSSHPSSTLHSLAASIGKAAWKEGVIGQLSIDFLSYPSSLVFAPPVLSLVGGEVRGEVLVPVSVSLHGVGLGSGFGLFHFLMGGRYGWRGRVQAGYRVMKAGVKEAREEEQKAMKQENKKKFHRASTSNLEQLIRPHTPSHPSHPTPPTPTQSTSPALPTFAARLLSRTLTSTLSSQEEERYYSIIPLLHLLPLSRLPLSSFFALCRVRQVSFDVGERRGLCFVLYGSMGAGRMGVMGVGRGREEGMRRVEAVLRLMEDEWKGQGEVEDEVTGISAGEVALRDVQRLVKGVASSMSQPQSRASALSAHSTPVLASRFPAIGSRH